MLKSICVFIVVLSSCTVAFARPQEIQFNSEPQLDSQFIQDPQSSPAPQFSPEARFNSAAQFNTGPQPKLLRERNEDDGLGNYLYT